MITQHTYRYNGDLVEHSTQPYNDRAAYGVEIRQLSGWPTPAMRPILSDDMDTYGETTEYWIGCELDGTVITMPPEYRDGVQDGWAHFVSVYEPTLQQTGFVTMETRPSGIVEPALVYPSTQGEYSPATFATADDAEDFAAWCRPQFGAGGAYGPVPVFTVRTGSEVAS